MFMVPIKFPKEVWQLLLEYSKAKLKIKKLTVVKPGTQKRRFTHIDDTINICIEAWRKNKNRHYSISSKKMYLL